MTPDLNQHDQQDVLLGASQLADQRAAVPGHITGHPLLKLILCADRWASIAVFSSVGPTQNGRFKADVIAPGTTLSAKSALGSRLIHSSSTSGKGCSAA